MLFFQGMLKFLQFGQQVWPIEMLSVEELQSSLVIYIEQCYQELCLLICEFNVCHETIVVFDSAQY